MVSACFGFDPFSWLLPEEHCHMSELLRHMSTTLDRIMALLEAKDERERRQYAYRQ
jgi:hypothetical protein